MLCEAVESKLITFCGGKLYSSVFCGLGGVSVRWTVAE
jgi:hypothetical protein